MIKKTTRLALLLAASLGLSISTAQAETHTSVVRWGPVHLPAATAEGPGEADNEMAGIGAAGLGAIGKLFIAASGYSQADYDVATPCNDCFITGIKPNLVLPDGTTANFNNGIMLHHVVNQNFSNTDVTCRPNPFGGLIQTAGFYSLTGGNERFFAAGNERSYHAQADGFGYYIGKNDKWGLVYHLMNMKPEARDVYFEYTFTWEDAKGSDLKRVRPLWIDIDQCDNSEMPVAAGYVDTTWQWKNDRTHKVTHIGGHLHNYGISIAWKNESKNTNICTSVAGYSPGSTKVPVGTGTGEDDAHPIGYDTVTSDPLGLENYKGNISDMTVCTDGAAAFTNKKRDIMKVHSQTYRPSATDHDMGIMVAFMEEKFCIGTFWCF
ncbi:MAG: hypothetical protein COA99_00620 [Moraxellaceae bacterium]|nr:MAG: hypothetical protein COA99_00620 [Moraxellaceae bacterium]